MIPLHKTEARADVTGARRLTEYSHDGPNGCRLWDGSKTTEGYGMLRVGGRVVYVHRVAYELANGTIADGLVIDHLCHDPSTCIGGPGCLHRSCINPAHLSAVTEEANTERSNWQTVLNRNKTHCPHGHPYDEANTYINPAGHRKCRECTRVSQRRRWAERQAAK